MIPQKKPVTILSLPSSAKAIIHNYFNLNVGGKTVQAPYYINADYTKPIANNIVLADITFNYQKKKTKKRVLVGKGSPNEIERATISCAKQFHFNIQKATKEEIKDFMEKHAIGVDCSALVVWVLNMVTMEKFGKPIWSYLASDRTGIIRQLLFRLRPVENISVKTLYSSRNSVSVKTIEEIQVGDMIISWWDEHVLLITEVGIGENKKPVYFEYINSTWWYGKKNGVLQGKVIIINPKGDLLDQAWEDFQEGKDWIREGAKHDSKIIRLKVLNSS